MRLLRPHLRRHRLIWGLNMPNSLTLLSYLHGPPEAPWKPLPGKGKWVPRLPQLAFPSGLSHFHVFDSPLLQFPLLFLAMLIKDASRPSRASRPEALTSHLIRIHHQHFDSYFINCTNFLHWPSSCHQVISKLLAELDSRLTGWSGTAFFFFHPG